MPRSVPYFPSPFHCYSYYGYATQHAAGELSKIPSQVPDLLLQQRKGHGATTADDRKLVHDHIIVMDDRRICVVCEPCQYDYPVYKFAFPVLDVCILHANHPFPASTRTRICLCNLIVQKNEHDLQPYILGHMGWKHRYLPTGSEELNGYLQWYRDSLGKCANNIFGELMQFVCRPDMYWWIIIGEVKEDNRDDFRILSIVMLDPLPVLDLQQEQISAKSLFARLVAEDNLAPRCIMLDALVMLLVAQHHEDYLLDRFIASRSWAAGGDQTRSSFIEDACFDALRTKVPDTVMCPRLKSLLIHTGRGKRSWTAWRNAFLHRLVVEMAPDMCLPLCAKYRERLPDDLTWHMCTQAKEAWVAGMKEQVVERVAVFYSWN